MRSNLFLFLAAIFALCCSNATPALANTLVSNEEAAIQWQEIQKASGIADFKQETNKSSRLERWIAKKALKKMAKKAPVDFDDPVEKWLWYGIFGLGLAVVISAFSLGVSGLIAFLAVVCLVVWLIKQGSA
jgi:hypothetical protein